MSAKSVEFLTLSDAAKSKGKAIGDVAEVLVQYNPILKDIKYTEANDGARHIESIRSSLPSVYYRKANQPIPASKSEIEEREFVAAHFESKSQIDVAVAKRGGMDRVPFNRWNQAQGHLQAMSIELANLTIYGSPASDHRKVPGLMDVYSTVATTEETSKQVIDAGGTGSDNASILIMTWNPQVAFGIYEAGSAAGIQRDDKGIRQAIGTTETGSTGTFDVYEEQFMVDHGLVVKDYRGGARVCNIDISDLQTGATTAADLLALMTRAHFKIPTALRALPGRTVYMNGTIYAYLFMQALNRVAAGAGLTYQNYQGEDIMMFLGAPIRECDALLNTESRVV
jgi:hypothetical protein